MFGVGGVRRGVYWSGGGGMVWTGGRGVCWGARLNKPNPEGTTPVLRNITRFDSHGSHAFISTEAPAWSNVTVDDANQREGQPGSNQACGPIPLQRSLRPFWLILPEAYACLKV